MTEDQPPPLPQPPPSLPAGPVAPQSLAIPPGAAARPSDYSTAMLVHLLALFTGFVGPLIIWLTKKDESPFIDHHGKEALNFQFFYLIVSLVLVLVTIFTFGLAIFITGPLLIVMAILFIVWEIQACVAANRGEWYRYPMSLRLIA